jgi:transcriptional regulator with XRE-family HTH domain
MLHVDHPYTPCVRSNAEKKPRHPRRGLGTQDGIEQIGERVARLRKERGITQQQMAELLKTSQPIVSDYERGELRLHGELIVAIARILDVTTDEILGMQQPKTTLPKDRRLLRRLKDVDKLPKRDREALVRTLDAFLARADITDDTEPRKAG